MPAKVTSNTDTIYLPPSFRAELRGPGQCAAYEELKEYYRACATGELPPQLHGLLKKLAEELLKKQDLCRNAASRRPGLSIIRLAPDDNILPAFRRRCLFARAAPTRQTVHSVDMSGRITPE